MNTQRDGDARRLRGHRGATLIEFAFIFPIFMTLVLGMFTGGTAYNQKSAMASAAREGARYASTVPVSSFKSDCSPSDPAALPLFDTQLNYWLHCVNVYVVNASEGSLGAGVPGWQTCVAYVYTDQAGTDKSLYDIHGVSPSSGSGSCPAANDAAPDKNPRVQVTTERDGKIQALFFKIDLKLSTKTVTRFEALP